MDKFILNKTKSSRDRYTLIRGSMGCAGEPSHYPSHHYEIVNGIDRGNGYQGYMNITYALTKVEYFPKEAKENLIEALDCLGFYDYLHEIGLR